MVTYTTYVFVFTCSIFLDNSRSLAEGWILVLIASVPGLCIQFTLFIRICVMIDDFLVYYSDKYIYVVNTYKNTCMRNTLYPA